MKVITHDGTFHTDEVFAIAFLRKFVLSKSIDIIRTRDEELLKNYVNDRDCFVIDVGRKYDEKNKNFDHHQRTFKERWNDGTLLSSCGLIWKYIKKKGYLKKYSNFVLRNIENKVIKKIDLHDNGEKNWPLANMVALCNREDGTMENFNAALDIASVYIDNIFYQETLNQKNEPIFEKDYNDYNGGEIFFSSISLKSGELLRKLSLHTKALVIIYQNHEEKDEKWYVKSLNRYYEHLDSTISALAPDEWRGMYNKKLTEINDIKGSLFVHRSGFMCVAKTKKAAILMAEKMIENYHSVYDCVTLQK